MTTASNRTRLSRVLRQVFGVSELRPGQRAVIDALMADQADKLSGLGLEAVQVNSAVSAGDIRHARKRIGRRSVEFVFTTPEQLAGADLPRLLGRAAVDLVVIDEAHC